MPGKRNFSKLAEFSFPLGRRKIGRYELLSSLAQGGMASVYLGRLSGMAGFEKLVAVKVIHPHLAHEEEFVGMFLDEARLSAKIHHQNITEIFEVGQDGGLYFMVAELVRGRSLKDLMAAATREGVHFEQRFFLSIVAKVCDALHSAHSLKDYDDTPLLLVHRDISPSNIMVSFDGNVKLIDFGIATARERITTTRSGLVKGKSSYLAPERIQGDSVDFRCDIFSLGVVLYLLATGIHPFSGKTQGEQLHRILNVTPKPPRSIVPEIPRNLEHVIDRALEKKPEDRYQAAAEMGRDIRGLLDSLGGLMDSPEVSDVVASLFAKEIAEEKRQLKQAVGVGLNLDGHEDGSPEHPSAYRSEASPSADIGKDGLAPSVGEAPPPGTEVMERPLTHVLSKFPAKKSLRVTPVVVVGAILLALLLISTTIYQTITKDSWRETQDSSNTGAAAVMEGKKSVPVNVPAKNHKNVPAVRPTESENDNVQAIREVESASRKHTIELLVENLPATAIVRLDGKTIPVKNGRISIPADGRPRELNVTAEGYVTYSQKIAPIKTSTLSIQMRKKRGASVKKDYNHAVKGKIELDENLMKCPYCKN